MMLDEMKLASEKANAQKFQQKNGSLQRNDKKNRKHR